MIQHLIVVGPLQCNCIILGCETTKEAILIDPGDEAGKIVEWVNEASLKVTYLFHTHAHFDHIGATAEVQKKLAGTICLHKDDNMIYENLPRQGQMFGMSFDKPTPVQKFLEDEEILSFGNYRIQVLHTPGHSPGGVCFKLLDDSGSLFSGDTLFRESVGRTDLWGGDTGLLIKSIKNRILTYDGDTAVFPGHGPSTTIAHESRNNPFL